MNLKRQLPQYIIGLFIMALGIVLIKKAGAGVSPVSAIPSALVGVTPLTFGNTTILFQVVCFLLILLVQRRCDVRTVLILPVAIAFGYIIDLYMYLLPFGDLPLWLAYVVCLLGIAATALGIVTIVGADLMLPSPDALLRTISATYHLPLSRVKMAGDACFVCVAVILQLCTIHRPLSPDCVWIGTLLSVLLTGRLVGIFGKCFPWLNVSKDTESAKS
jgi:uncharacterized membrane protein YczE